MPDPSRKIISIQLELICTCKTIFQFYSIQFHTQYCMLSAGGNR